jgi:DNA-directed RNA polymerase
LGISKSAAEKDDFHFVCKECLQKEEDAKRPKISLKFRVGASSSPAPPSPALVNPQSARPQQLVAVEIPKGDVVQQSSPANQPPTSPYRSLNSDGTHQQASSSQLFSTDRVGSQHRPITSTGSQIMSNGQGQLTQPAALVSSSQPLHHASSHQQPLYNGQQPVALPHQTPQQSSHSFINGQSAAASERLPSPVLNPPTMSPTQGNMDVGPVAGVPRKSSSPEQHVLNGLFGAGNGFTQNGIPSYSQSTPSQVRHTSGPQSPTTQPTSGLSPTKQQTPLPPRSSTHAPIKHQRLSPAPPLSQQINYKRPANASAHAENERRTVSGTPILPPVENLRPSPEQMRNMSSNEPVPTPSKSALPPVHGAHVPSLVSGGTNGMSTEGDVDMNDASPVPAPRMAAVSGGMTTNLE